MTLARYRREAALHRAALLLGLDQGQTVVAWAEAALAADDQPPVELVEIAMTPAGDLSALRHALAAWEEHQPQGLTAALVDRAARDLAAGRRSLTDTFTVLAQLRRNLALSPAVDLRLAQFDNGYLLARARIAGDPAEVGTELANWLTGFDGAEAAFLRGPVDRILEMPTEQASAFIAALSRYLASPAAAASVDPAEVWAVAALGSVRLFLNDTAWQAADRAFAPVPRAEARPADLRPSEARRVLDGRERRPMGSDEAALR